MIAAEKKPSGQQASATVRAKLDDKRQLRVWAALRDESVPKVVAELVRLAIRSGWPIREATKGP